MSTGAWIALAAVVVALAFGGWRARRDGRFQQGGGEVVPESAPRSAASGSPEPASPWRDIATAVGAGRPGERATLVQFSSAFCAPCRATRTVLAGVAEKVPGVVHVEVDAEQHLELVRRLEVTRTPTTIVLDAAGREVARAAGAPRTEQVLAALPL